MPAFVTAIEDKAAFEEKIRNYIVEQLREALLRDKPHPVANYGRFWAKVECRDGCWTWTASTTGKGYPRWREGSRWKVGARVAWERLIGEIPEGLYINRTCGNKLCVNPMHGELLTVAETGRKSANAERLGPSTRPKKWDQRRKVRSRKLAGQQFRRF